MMKIRWFNLWEDWLCFGLTPIKFDLHFPNYKVTRFSGGFGLIIMNFGFYISYHSEESVKKFKHAVESGKLITTGHGNYEKI